MLSDIEFTPKENKIYKLLIEGFCPQEIAEKVWLSQRFFI